jgi:serine/threonine protein kinase
VRGTAVHVLRRFGGKGAQASARQRRDAFIEDDTLDWYRSDVRGGIASAQGSAMHSDTSDAPLPDEVQFPAWGATGTNPDRKIVSKGRERESGRYVIGGATYEMGKALGRGTMGLVFELRPADSASGAPELAVKILNGFTNATGAKHLVRKEGDDVAAANHADSAYRVKYHAYIETDTGPELVMDRMRSSLKTLHAELEEDRLGGEARVLSTTEAVGVLQYIHREIMRALAELHVDEQATHADLKPENVMLTPDFGVTLIDVGFIKATNTQDDVPHTRGYAPPDEKAMTTEGRWDVYSAGVTAAEGWRAATGQDVSHPTTKEVDESAVSALRGVDDKVIEHFADFLCTTLAPVSERPTSTDALKHEYLATTSMLLTDGGARDALKRLAAKGADPRDRARARRRR